MRADEDGFTPPPLVDAQPRSLRNEMTLNDFELDYLILDADNHFNEPLDCY